MRCRTRCLVLSTSSDLASGGCPGQAQVARERSPASAHAVIGPGPEVRFTFRAQALDGYFDRLNYVGRWGVMVGGRMGTPLWRVQLCGWALFPRTEIPKWMAVPIWSRGRFSLPILTLGFERCPADLGLRYVRLWVTERCNLPLVPGHHAPLSLSSAPPVPLVFPQPFLGGFRHLTACSASRERNV